MLQTRGGCQTFSQRQTLSSQGTSGTFVEFKYRDFFLKLTSFLFLSLRTDHNMQRLSELNDVLEITDLYIHSSIENYLLFTPAF